MTERVLVCVPVDAGEAGRIAEGHTLPGPVQAFTANDALLDAFGLQPSDDEQAEYAVLLLAGLYGLIRYGARLVLTALVDPQTLTEGEEADNGGVALSELAAGSVEAWFSDEDDVLLPELREAVSGLSLDDAWDTPEITALHADHDLAWHSITELPRR